MPLLEIENLTLDFATRERRVRVLDGVSLEIAEGETLCLVGESGSGKSVTALSIGRLLPSPPAEYGSGEIRLNGQNVLAMSKRDLRRIRGGVVAYVFQEPGSSLNPVFRIGDQIKESLELHRPEAANDHEVIRLLNLVGIPAPETRIKDYPHQLSGGMQQRAVIAMALASQPKLLIADEPTTALDVTIQAQILELLARLKAELKMSILLITHTLGIVKEIADRVAVMYAGQIVETGRTNEIFSEPFHPYTRALLESVPQLGSDNQRLISIPGNVPQLGAFPSGCRFHPRCPQARPDCSTNPPPMIEAAPGRFVRCPYWNAPLPEPKTTRWSEAPAELFHRQTKEQASPKGSAGASPHP